MAGSSPVIDDFAKAYLHSDLCEVRETMLWKLDGLSEYDARRPLTSTGTNLLGLIKHVTIAEARYFGTVFGRPFPERLPWWDDDADFGADMWATDAESRAPRSSTDTGGHASTRTRRSPRSTSTRPAMCPGGHART
jgi:hypothetical protein